MNSHSTQAAAFVVVSIWAIVSTKGAHDRRLAVLFVALSMAGGVALGFVISLHESSAIRDNTAISMMILLGAISAIGCIFRNTRRGRRWPFTAR
jgi:hypothetical protein